MTKEYKIGKTYWYFGISKKAFGLGARIDRWSFSADLGPFWLGVEW